MRPSTILFSLCIVIVSAKYVNFESHGEESYKIAHKILNAFAAEQNIDDEKLELLDVLDSKQQLVFTPNDTYNMGHLFKQRLSVGIAECKNHNICPINQAILFDATLLSVVNQPAEFAFKLLSDKA